MNALTNLLNTGQSRPTPIGQQQVPVREGAMLNAIARYADMAKREMPDEAWDDALEYLTDSGGEWAVTPDSAEARAERLVEFLLEGTE